MTVPARLAAFAVLLLLVFGGAALAGAAIDPTDEAPAPAGHERPAAHERPPAHGPTEGHTVEVPR